MFRPKFMETIDPLDFDPPRRLLIVDDHPVLRNGVKEILQAFPKLCICAEADNAVTALDAVKRLQPEVALVDLSLPDCSGIQLIDRMLAADGDLRILVFSMHDDPGCVLGALRAGARGYLRKDEGLDTLFAAFQTVLEGRIFLSPQFRDRPILRALQDNPGKTRPRTESLSTRESEVLTLIGNGKRTAAIAAQLHISVKTVETHRVHIKEKLAIADVLELTRFAREWCLAAAV